MLKKVLLIVLLMAPFFLFAQTGKIVGQITDAETGEPLPGANVLIEGTFLGAAADIDGNFLILNVDPGTYTIKVQFVGYSDYVLKNVGVSANLTTEVNVKMKSKSIQAETITVVAERPLVNKNITNSNTIIKAADIKNLPARTVTNIVAQNAGVVTQGGDIHVRGSRGDAVAYYVDGVLVNNPVFGGAQTALISNAIEEIQFQAGGYSAEYGGANGGIISTQSRTGRNEYKFHLEAITDNFAPLGKEYLGGYSYGYSEYVATVGGPLLPNKKLRFFLAANNVFQRTPAHFYRGFDFGNIYDPSLGAAADTFHLYRPSGYVPNDQENTYNVQGNMTWDIKPFILKLSGTFRRRDGRDGVNYYNYNTRDRAGVNQAQTITTSLKITQVFGSNSYYDLIANYFNDYYVDMDPVFRENIPVYGDSIENAQRGYHLKGDGQPPKPIDAFGYQFASQPRPYNYFRKQRTESYGLKLNYLYQAGRHHELKTGFEGTQYTIRRYALRWPMSIASLQRSVADGNIYDMYNRLDNYGYDVYGNVTNTSGLEAPKKPVFAGAYVEDKMEFKDLIIQAGLRLDYIDIDSKEFKDPHNVQFTANDEIDPAGLKDVKPYKYVSPRLGFSFPVTATTIFHAQYGKFVQQSRLRDVYQGYNVLADNIKGGYAISQPVGFGLRPERTTSYELGFKQQFGDVFAMDLTLFYKDVKDQIQERQIFADPQASHSRYYAWTNGDFSTIKGFELKLKLRRTNRIAGSLNYTFSNAEGTGSNPSTSFRAIWQSPTKEPYFPMQIAPLDFNQAHRGYLNIDYRFTHDDGPTLLGSKIFSNSGANLLFSFTSGFNYTRWKGFVDFDNGRVPLEPLNSSTTPWTYQLDMRLDKSFSIGSFDLNAYLWVTNVLNTQNVVAVYNSSGDAYDDGYIDSNRGQSKVQGYDVYGKEFGQLYSKVYRALHYTTSNFGPPRQVRLGLKVDF